MHLTEQQLEELNYIKTHTKHCIYCLKHFFQHIGIENVINSGFHKMSLTRLEIITLLTNEKEFVTCYKLLKSNDKENL